MTNPRPEPALVTHEQIDGAAKWIGGVLGTGVGGFLIRNVVRGWWTAHRSQSDRPEPSAILLERVNDVASKWVDRMDAKVVELEAHVNTLQSEIQGLRQELARAVVIEADNEVLRRLLNDLQAENKRLREENIALKAAQSA